MPGRDDLGVRVEPDGSIVLDVPDRLGQVLEAVQQFCDEVFEPLAETAAELEGHREQHPDDPVWSMDLEDALPVVARKVPVWRSQARRSQLPAQVRRVVRPRNRARRERRAGASSRTSSADPGDLDEPPAPGFSWAQPAWERSR